MTKCGDEIDVSLAVTPVRSLDGRVIGLLSVSRDITESKQTEKRLRDTAHLSSIGELAAGVAHEINNPLTSVLGFSQMLMSADLPEQIKEDLATVHYEAGRAATIVKNLLSFARRAEPFKMYMDVTSVLERAVGMKAYDFQVGNIEVTRDYATALPLTMLDEQQLIQVTLNILTNAEQAIHKMRKKGNIIVRTGLSGGLLRISIIDDGPGISSEHLNKIFEPFFTTKAIGEGTGLGLSVSYGIIQQHGGEIRAEGAPGGGMAFHIDLPITDKEDTKQPSVSTNQPASGTKQVLVVDDEPNIRKMLFRLLKSDGYEVDLAEDGSAAWRMVQSHDYDCIILDLKMAGINGQDLYRMLQIYDEQLAKRVIFITGDTVSRDTNEFVAQCGNTTLTKPLDFDETRRQVHNMLTRNGGVPN